MKKPCTLFAGTSELNALSVQGMSSQESQLMMQSKLTGAIGSDVQPSSATNFNGTSGFNWHTSIKRICFTNVEGVSSTGFQGDHMSMQDSPRNGADGLHRKDVTEDVDIMSSDSSSSSSSDE